ncbi:hypothetical protein AB0D08_21210 [Kitasatospora sp. NPDC048540]|uniref:hypothetical protein n=1 Tax=unclassified Kitasatospora TaxID=2633591 RepID=UPI00068BCFD4|nr:hypothetical protein [Kitasatospora sp. MBT63]
MTPFDLPIDVALARPVEDFPGGPGLLLTPAVDGWRAVLRTGADAALFSSHGTDLTRTFADLAAAARDLPQAVLDGEILAVLPNGDLSSALLHTRAGGGPRRGEPFVVRYAAFDLLGLADDWRPLPHRDRYERLVRLLNSGSRTIRALPATDDPHVALEWTGPFARGVVARPAGLPYLPGHGSKWLSWQRHRTAEQVGADAGPTGDAVR